MTPSRSCSRTDLTREVAGNVEDDLGPAPGARDIGDREGPRSAQGDRHAIGPGVAQREVEGRARGSPGRHGAEEEIAPGRLPGDREVAGHAAVSYTHLRAQ